MSDTPRIIERPTLLYVNLTAEGTAGLVFRDEDTGQVFEVPGGPVVLLHPQPIRRITPPAPPWQQP